MVVDDLNTIGICFQNLTPGATVVLIAPFDVRRRDRPYRRGTLCLAAEKRSRSLRPRRTRSVGECRMVVEFVTEVLDQAVVQCHQEIVRLAVPSCCCGSNQRAAILVCQARTIFPAGLTSAIACGANTVEPSCASVAAPPANTLRLLTAAVLRGRRRQSNPTRGAALFQHERALPVRPSGPGRFLWFTTFAGRGPRSGHIWRRVPMAAPGARH